MYKFCTKMEFYELIIYETPTVARFKYFSKYCTLRFKNYEMLSDEIVYGVFDDVLSFFSRWIDCEDVVQLTIKQQQYDKVVKVHIPPRPFSTLTTACIMDAVKDSKEILVTEDINVCFSVSKMYPRNIYKSGEF